MRADVVWLCHADRRGRGSYQVGGQVTASWLGDRFRELGLVVREQEIARGVRNVFGVLPGGPEVVMVSAHYDHLGERGGAMYPGADDNASGVAVMLALARALAGKRFEHTIVFAGFGAEEDALAGSRHYLGAPLWPLSKTRAIVNFDMVGRHFFEGGSSKPKTAAVVGLEGDAGARAAADRAAEQAGLTLIRAPAPLVELFGFANRTDEWPFRRRGVMAVHFSTGLHPDYHRPSDTPDKLQYGQMARIARTAAAIIEYFAEPRVEPGQARKGANQASE